MTRRRQSIVLLAGSLLDGLWFPSRPSGSSGLSGGRKVPCPACSNGDRFGSGWVTDRYRRQLPCETCGGGETPALRPRRGLGFVRIDDYDRDRRPLTTEETPDAPPPMVSVKCDACFGEGAFGNGRRCTRCGGAGWRSWPRETPEPDEWRGESGLELLAAIERRDLSGDYAALDRALGHLRQLDPFGWRVWTGRYVSGLVSWELRHPDVLEDSWGFVDREMPHTIRVPADVRESERARRKHLEAVRGRHTDPKARTDRDREIRRRFERGEATIEELVRIFGLHKSTIYEAIHGGR